MSLRAWRTAYSSVVGTSHAASGTSCQDDGRCVVFRDASGTEVLVSAVADGAGSASRSERGASLIVGSFIDAMGIAIVGDDGGLAFMDRAFVIRWLDDARSALTELALAEDHPIREYACTFIGAVIGDRCACYLQIGDGAIVVVDEEGGDPAYVFWPQHGEFANSTFFVTHDGAGDILQFERREFGTGHAHIREIALFTDGLERLVLDFAARAVHPPALRPIFSWLSRTDPDDADGCNRAIESYLASAHVNRRTDDDKTLVMATRATPPAEVIQVPGQ